jgi:hypothetical protein
MYDSFVAVIMSDRVPTSYILVQVATEGNFNFIATADCTAAAFEFWFVSFAVASKVRDIHFHLANDICGASEMVSFHSEQIWPERKTRLGHSYLQNQYYDCYH